MRPCRPVLPDPAPRSCCRSAGSAGRPRHLLLSPVGTAAVARRCVPIDPPLPFGRPRTSARSRTFTRPTGPRTSVRSRTFARSPSLYVRTPAPLVHPPVPTHQPIRARHLSSSVSARRRAACSSWGWAAACTRPAHTLGSRTCPVAPARPAVRAHLDIAAGNRPHTGCGRPHVPCTNLWLRDGAGTPRPPRYDQRLRTGRADPPRGRGPPPRGTVQNGTPSVTWDGPGAFQRVGMLARAGSCPRQRSPHVPRETRGP